MSEEEDLQSRVNKLTPEQLVQLRDYLVEEEQKQTLAQSRGIRPIRWLIEKFNQLRKREN